MTWLILLALFGAAWLVCVLALLLVVLAAWLRGRVQTPAKSVEWIPAKPRDVVPGSDDASTDIATEGLGEWDPWPGIEAINAVRAANPKLTDMHAYAVAKARKRLRAPR